MEAIDTKVVPRRTASIRGPRRRSGPALRALVAFSLLTCAFPASRHWGTASAKQPEEDTRSPVPSWVDRDEYHLLWPDDETKQELGAPLSRYSSLLIPAQMSEYDVQHYDLDIMLIPDSSLVRGSATISAVSLQDGLALMRVDLAGLQATRVSSQGADLSFDQDSEGLSIQLPSAAPSGDTFQVTIEYGGVPSRGLYFNRSQGVHYTMSEPSEAHYWYPCKDHPSDKATLRMAATVPTGLIVASNGLLVEEFHPGDPRQVTYVWEESNPIATYLISLAASEYAVFQDTFVKPGSGDRIDVIYYVHPEDSSDAAFDFASTVDMMEYFSSVFGDYPFSKYGMAMAPLLGGWGAMEHQTCATMGDHLVTGTGRYEWLVAHELAHQWWGDLVTLSDWPHIWLNEGFAVYCDALYTAHEYGDAAFRTRMEVFADMYFWEDQYHRYPIYDPDILFGHVVYEKGAWVLHMLRYVVGEDDFWEILPLYAERFAYGNASIPDFQQVCEEVSGLDLEWFFDQWIYEAGHPRLEVSWWAEGLGARENHRMVGTVLQLQVNAPYFRIPLEIAITGQAGQDTTILVQTSNSEPSTSFSAEIPWTPRALTIDPNGWVLHQSATSQGDEDRVVVYPNPMASPTGAKCIISFWLPAPQPVTLEVCDVLGRKVKTLVEDPTPWPKGHHLRSWDGTNGSGNQVGSGTYYVRLSAGSRQKTEKVMLIR